MPRPSGRALFLMLGIAVGGALSGLQFSAMSLPYPEAFVLAVACSPAVLFIPAVPLLFSTTPAYPVLAIIFFPLALVLAVLGTIGYWTAASYLLARCGDSRYRSRFLGVVLTYCAALLVTLLVTSASEWHDASRLFAGDSRSLRMTVAATVVLIAISNLSMAAVYVRRRMALASSR